jgi:hypothetical protein
MPEINRVPSQGVLAAHLTPSPRAAGTSILKPKRGFANTGRDALAAILAASGHRTQVREDIFVPRGRRCGAHAKQHNQGACREESYEGHQLLVSWGVSEGSILKDKDSQRVLVRVSRSRSGVGRLSQCVNMTA